MKPFFSVVIPTLNEEEFLPRLLEDLAKQKERRFEVIVVDGYSEDNTARICQIETRFPIQVLKTKKRNVSSQRNIGARRGIGRYIVFIDADARVESDFLQKAMHAIQKTKYLIYLPTMIPDLETTPHTLYMRLNNLAVELSQNTTSPFSNSGTFLIERSFFQHLGGFDEKLRLSEDHDIIKRARMCGVSAKFSHDIQFFFSLRRYEKEGLLKILMKYTIAFFYQVTNTRMEKELFSYEMGGGHYKNKAQNKTLEEFKKLYQKLKSTLEIPMKLP